MRHRNKNAHFPTVTADQRIVLKSKEKPYDYQEKLMTQLGFDIQDWDSVETIDTVEQREWDTVTKSTEDHFVLINGSWTYTCSTKNRRIDRKFRCIGGPLDGTNQPPQYHGGSEYIMFNCGGRGADQEFSAVMLHHSLLSA
jgi:hypothetical protein